MRKCTALLPTTHRNQPQLSYSSGTIGFATTGEIAYGGHHRVLLIHFLRAVSSVALRTCATTHTRNLAKQRQRSASRCTTPIYAASSTAFQTTTHETTTPQSLLHSVVECRTRVVFGAQTRGTPQNRHAVLSNMSPEGSPIEAFFLGESDAQRAGEDLR